jgi:hypothetical protein
MSTQTNTQVWTNSLFIPRLDFNISKVDVKKYFEETYPLGTVSRVDFVSFNNDNGVGRRAFVHFSKFTNEKLKQLLLSEGKYDVCLNGCNVRLIINEKPVPETKLNLNQVAHNTEFIGEEVKIQQDKIEEMEDKMDKMEKDARVHNTIVESLQGQIAYLTDMITYMQSQMMMPQVSIAPTLQQMHIPMYPFPPQVQAQYSVYPPMVSPNPPILSLLHPDTLPMADDMKPDNHIV